MKEGDGRSLTRREFDAVIRRAAELAASDPESEGALTEAEVYRIAGEVGLSDEHVRRALVDVRHGTDSQNFLDRVYGPATVRASRVVPKSRGEIARELDDFLVATQLLQPVRRGAEVLQYRPAVDWASQIARAASFTSRKYYIASAKSVDVHLEELEEGRTLVELVVDPGTRGDDVAGSVFGGGALGGGAGFLTGWFLTTLTPVGLAIGGGAVVGGGIFSGIAYAVGRSHKKKIQEVQNELEGVLDALELGRSLEPPPPSWRRWVKRQFHGVAKDLMGTAEEID